MISTGLLAALIVIAIIMLTGFLLNLCHCIARCMNGVPNGLEDDVQDVENKEDLSFPHFNFIAV